MPKTVYLSFGSNLGDRESNLVKGLQMVEAMEGFELLAESPIYIGPAQEMNASAPDFLNMVVKGEYQYRPLELLNNLQQIEKKLGRTGKGENRPRSLDIDILFFGEEIIETDRLSVPHRKITERLFVLVPLLQIEPDLIHPATGERLAIYLKDMDQSGLLMYKETIDRHV